MRQRRGGGTSKERTTKENILRSYKRIGSFHPFRKSKFQIDRNRSSSSSRPGVLSQQDGSFIIHRDIVCFRRKRFSICIAMKKRKIEIVKNGTRYYRKMMESERNFFFSRESSRIFISG